MGKRRQLEKDTEARAEVNRVAEIGPRSDRVRSAALEVSGAELEVNLWLDQRC